MALRKKFRIFRCSELESACFDFFKYMQSKNEYCDVIIQTECVQITAHRIVVAAVIPYFRSKFGVGKTCGIVKVEEKGIDTLALASLIEFAYTHEVEISTDNVKELLVAASTFKVDQVRDACIEFITEELRPENAFEIWQLADELNYCELKGNVDDYICQNFDAVVGTDNSLDASETYVKELTGKDDLQTSSEETVFEFVMKWVKKEQSKRKDFLPEILRNIRMKLLSPHYLVHSVAAEELIKSSFPCRDLLDEARNYYVLLSNTEKDLVHSGRRSESHLRKKIVARNCSSGLYLVSEESSLIVQCFDADKKGWVTRKSVTTLITGTATEVGGTLCYVDRGLLRLYHPLSNTWSQQNVYAVPRYFCGSALLNSMLYVCGGRDDKDALNVVECFDTERDFERYIVAPMSKCRNACGVVTLGECLYAIGGQDGSGVHDSVEMYNPNSNLWTAVPPMMTKRCFFGCTSFGGKIYVCGGIESFSGMRLSSSAEVFDPVKNKWTYISSMEKTRHLFSLLPYRGKLYAVDGQNDNRKYMTTMEVYDPEKNEWKRGPPINCSYKCVRGAAVLPA